ncbi:hypothetical protein PEC106568_07520 [Pectobacterium carotovorum subsp. carotovorum]|nr:hypothetical protein PEC106568_07520 [Pectobacterium carotovorum subsp. carotovorum]
MTDLLSKERLDKLRASLKASATLTVGVDAIAFSDAAKAIDELLQRREAAKEPVAWLVGDATLYNPDTVKAYVKRSGLPVKPLFTAPPLPVVPQTLLRELVDVVWQEAKESTEMPSTKWADELIGRVFPAAQTLLVVPDEATPENIQALSGCITSRNGGWHDMDEGQRDIAVDVWNACRAAMLQSVNGNKGAE